jgi:hypothetical protein
MSLGLNIKSSIEYFATGPAHLAMRRKGFSGLTGGAPPDNLLASKGDFS